MIFKPILWTHKPRKDGRCAVKIYGKRLYFHVPKVAIHPEDWDEANAKVKRSNALHAQINAVIRAKLLEVESAHLEGRELPKKKKAPAPAPKADVSIYDFIGTYIAETANGEHEISIGTIKHYQSLQLRLKQFGIHRGKPIVFADIDQKFYGDFFQFLHQNFGIQKAGGFSKHIKILKNSCRKPSGAACTTTMLTVPVSLKYIIQKSKKST